MKRLQRHRIKARTRLQYEAAECGAASLGTILAYFGRVVELGELRLACGVNRDGANAKQLLVAGRQYGLKARAYRCSGEQLKREGQFPCVVFWGFNHFLVVEGFDADHAFLSDPAQGRVRVEMEEFQDNFTGVVLEFEPGPEFQTGGHERSPLLSLPATLAPYRHSIAVLLLVSSGQAVLTVLVAGFTSTFIDSFLQNQRLYFGIPLIWLLLITVLAWLALLAGQFLVLRRMELLLSKRLTADLFRKLFQVTFAFYQARFQGEIASRMLLGMQTTQVVIAQMLRFGLSLWIGLFVLIFAFVISAWLALLVLVVMAGNLFLNWWLTDQRYDSNRRLAIEQGKAQGKGLQGINNIETLKASGLEFDFLSQWQGSFGNVVTQNQQLGAQMALATITASGSTFLLSALIITAGGLLIIAGKMSLGTLVAFQFLQGQLTAPISSLPQLNATLQQLIGSLGRLDDLKRSDDDPLVRSFALPAHSSQPHESEQMRLQGHLELENLSYSFNPVSPPFISNLSLSIPAGSQLAIVGGSGSGKTTLIRVLAGLYQPSGGRLLFDGRPWEHHGDRLMRDSLAYVPQQVFMFNASIHDNITLWRSGYRLQDLEEAAHDAQILNTITSHPEAFARHLKDNGSDLSGGERQRMELCRALLRRPSILLLDEATSALDNSAQMQVLNALKARGLTVVSVAHRLDAALRSDQVLVMAQGAVVELGSPQELLDQSGAFRALVDSERVGQGMA
ncbi:ABC multidrug efflux transporter [Synechococcus sp. PROS-7-1]|uniref:ATP-binding cassette domain-containing protein n=1 Tax=Synechococcus sp. PROS-7-1 TaxID=1442556 RepID=UPI0016444437|nr:ATP-binding cassette domain-containing protein [Synechococcus sp. PROS-7-1]QNI84249.1 ABC multidrug efflux transporter [Synechococcus sp. PROS-7-1]